VDLGGNQLLWYEKPKVVEIKESCDLDWSADASVREALEAVAERVYGGNFGEVNSLSISNIRVNGHPDICVSIGLGEVLPSPKEEGLTAVPDFFLLPLKSGVIVRVSTRVFQSDPYQAYAMPQGSDVKTSTDQFDKVGVIWHVEHNNVIQAVCCAHVLTYFRNDMIEEMDFSDDYKVAGYFEVKTYPFGEKVPAPVRAEYDFVWCTPPKIDRAALEFPDIGIPEPPRDTVDDGEKVKLYCKAL